MTDMLSPGATIGILGGGHISVRHFVGRVAVDRHITHLDDVCYIGHIAVLPWKTTHTRRYLEL